MAVSSRYPAHLGRDGDRADSGVSEVFGGALAILGMIFLTVGTVHFPHNRPRIVRGDFMPAGTLGEAPPQRRSLTGLTEGSKLITGTAILEEDLDEWSNKEHR